MTSRRIQRRLNQVIDMNQRLGYPDHLKQLQMELVFRANPIGEGRTQEMRMRRVRAKVRRNKYISKLSRRRNRGRGGRR